MFIICDIDGVLADVTELLPLITGGNKDYELYYSRIEEAKPLWRGLDIVQGLNRQAFLKYGAVYFITGRRESSRQETIDWLQRHGACGEKINLYMRKDGDLRSACKLKEEHLKVICKDIPFSDITVFEDDPQCVEMYVNYGCYVCHVKHEKARS